MKAFFVEDLGCCHYADWIVRGKKTIETRSKNMLENLVGERVAVVKTKKGKKPMVVGYVDMYFSWFCQKDKFDSYVNKHLVSNPGSKYYANTAGKWMYNLKNAEACVPYELPNTAIRHGRSWCEF